MSSEMQHRSSTRLEYPSYSREEGALPGAKSSTRHAPVKCIGCISPRDPLPHFPFSYKHSCTCFSPCICTLLSAPLLGPAAPRLSLPPSFSLFLFCFLSLFLSPPASSLSRQLGRVVLRVPSLSSIPLLPSTIASWEPTGERVTTLAPNRSLVLWVTLVLRSESHASLIHNSELANRTKLIGISKYFLAAEAEGRELSRQTNDRVLVQYHLENAIFQTVISERLWYRWKTIKVDKLWRSWHFEGMIHKWRLINTSNGWLIFLMMNWTLGWDISKYRAHDVWILVWVRLFPSRAWRVSMTEGRQLESRSIKFDAIQKYWRRAFVNLSSERTRG